MFKTILERVRSQTTTEEDAKMLEQLLNAAARMAEAEWFDGTGWKCLSALRAAIKMWREHYRAGPE